MNILDSLKKYFYKNGSSEASSDARIPLLTATGEPKGSDTMANIASVLGKQIQTLENYDINDLYSEGGKGNSLYKLVDCTNTPSGLNYSMLHVFYDGGDCYQMAFSPIYSVTDYVFIRRRGNGHQWSDWSTISLNMPSFYKDYNNLSSLASALEVTMSRRTRLEDFSLSTLQQAVADQNLEKYGLRVGDQKTINGRTYVIAGLNPMKGTSTPYRINQNHVGLIVIPHTTQKWNESGNTYEGAGGRGAGYKNSDLHAYLKDTILPMCQSDLGSANLISHYKLLSNAVNTSGINRFGNAGGCSSSWDWEADCFISALSEVQVYGGTVWSSSGYDTGEACRQLDVFQKYSHTEIFGGEYPWLRDVVSASYAAIADVAGYANGDTASDARYVAAIILFK